MTGGDPSPAASFEHRMGGDRRPILEDADLVGQRVHLDDALPGGVGDAVEIAADRDHAFVRDPALQFEHRAERQRRQLLQLRLLLGEGFGHHPSGRGVNAHVGHGGEPVGELGVQVVEIAERPAEEEVLADVAERPLHLALGLRPVGPAGFRVKVVMAGEVEQRAVVDDAAFRRLADDGGLHPVVEDLLRHAAEVGERRDVAAQDRLQVLMQDEARPQPAAGARAPARTARRSASHPARR